MCTEIVSDIQNIFLHNMFSPCSAKRRASDKDLPVLSNHGNLLIIKKCGCKFEIRMSKSHLWIVQELTYIIITGLSNSKSMLTLKPIVRSTVPETCFSHDCMRMVRSFLDTCVHKPLVCFHSTVAEKSHIELKMFV